MVSCQQCVSMCMCVDVCEVFGSVFIPVYSVLSCKALCSTFYCTKSAIESAIKIKFDWLIACIEVICLVSPLLCYKTSN